MSSVRDRLRGVRERIAASAQAAGRSVDEVTLIAVTKQQPVDKVLEAYAEGVRDFGENTVQGLCSTAEALHDKPVRWHFIGHLQRNKVNKLLPHVSVIHSVDRAELVGALAERAGAKPLDVLVQVNVGREVQKGGVDPDGALALAQAVAGRPTLRLRGLMAIPPEDAEPRPFFESLRRLRDELVASPGCSEARELSMGMSEDFETAIQCGATLVRVGTGIFGPRQARSRA